MGRVKEAKNGLKRIWNYLKKDTWDSWLVSLVLLYVGIKFVFFPILAFATGSPMPLMVVESCSMYHGDNFNNWWNDSKGWYLGNGIDKEAFKEFAYKNGLNKGDIVFVWGRGDYNLGDVIIFSQNKESTRITPTIHREISESPIATKGDNNQAKLTIGNNIYHLDETNIAEERVLGKAVLRIPFAGWFKLIFFEPFRPASERGFCRENQKLNIVSISS